jgi:hypothetical protein
MMVGLLAFRVDSLTYTIAKALSYGGYDVSLHSISQEHVCDIDTRLSKMLAATPGVTVRKCDESEIPAVLDHLVVQGHPQLLEHRSMLRVVARHAKCLTIISSGDRKLSTKKTILKQWRELRWYGHMLFRVKRVVYKDGFYPADLFGLFFPRSVIGFDVHSKFLCDQEAFSQIHARDWKINTQRPILANFLGSQDPDRRLRIVDSVRSFFNQNDDKPSTVSPAREMFWHEFSDTSPAVMGASEYLDVLSQSDFTLCPPGYSLVTHRPLEALLRGSIPILNSNELDLYDMDFQDGVNCIAASPDDWPSTIERLFQFKESAVIEMRRNISSMFGNFLDYEISSKHMRIRLGLEG